MFTKTAKTASIVAAIALVALTQVPASAATRTATAVMTVSVTVLNSCHASLNQAAALGNASAVSVSCNSATPYSVHVTKNQSAAASSSALANSAPALSTVAPLDPTQAVNAGAGSANQDTVLVSITY